MTESAPLGYAYCPWCSNLTNTPIDFEVDPFQCNECHQWFTIEPDDTPEGYTFRTDRTPPPP